MATEDISYTYKRVEVQIQAHVFPRRFRLGKGTAVSFLFLSGKSHLPRCLIYESIGLLVGRKIALPLIMSVQKLRTEAKRSTLVL